jgi:hypothetical protein
LDYIIYFTKLELYSLEISLGKRKTIDDLGIRKIIEYITNLLGICVRLLNCMHFETEAQHNFFVTNTLILIFNICEKFERR